MSTKQTRPYGSWRSPVSSRSLVEKSLRLGNIQIEGNSIIWTEGRPEERGRTALMNWTEAGGMSELSSPEMNIRSKVHEYGGKSFTSTSDAHYYIEFSDQQVHILNNDGSSEQLTDAKNFRYIDLVVDEKRNRLIAVGEDHSDPANIENLLVSIPLTDSQRHEILAKGHDFYASPAISQDGSQLAFITWDHPNMPWDGNELWLCDLNDQGTLENLRKIAGGQTESIFQPQWGSNGTLYFVSDRSGWWNLYKLEGEEIQNILEMDAEFGLPQWVFGMSTYAVLGDSGLLAAYRDINGSHLIRLGSDGKISRTYDLGYTNIEQVRALNGVAAFIGSGPDTPAEIVAMDLDTGDVQSIQASASITFDKAYISEPRAIEFGSRPGESAFAWYYPPTNPEFEAPAEEKPPLIVLSHGGPTAYSPGVFAMAKQYWTSRGFAVVDVNYSGSTGFGRQYRERLRGTWGIRDVEDCTAAARHLANEGVVDANRLIIKGGSAGGYTTLASLAFTNVFQAGASYYGVADLELLAKDSHKFESRYLDSMVGKYPEEKETYFNRSPVNFADRIDCPVIFLQGLEDPVVPPNQAEIMVTALKDSGIPVSYLPFEGESHGFRQASTIIRSAEAELYFYSRIFDLELPDSLDPIEIYNL